MELNSDEKDVEKGTEDKKWWRELDSNQRRLSRQIYSLIPLAAREPLQCNGADNSKLRI